MEPLQTPIYRMTHIENVPHILENGITHRDSINSNPEYKSIGDSSLIHRRNSFLLPNGRRLGDYIPFYFGLRTPMLYVIQNGFNGVLATNPEEIVYIVSNLALVHSSGIQFLYTDGHATDRFTRFYTPHDVDHLADQVDFSATNAVYWRKDDDLDFKRRKEAEFLLENDLPAAYISGIIAYNQQAEQTLVQMGAELAIFVKPDSYF